MEEWQSVNIETGDIRTKTEKAYLVELPQHTAKNLDVPTGSAFWFPSALVRIERGAMELRLPPDFEIKLFTSSKEGERWEKKDQGTIGSQTLVENWPDSPPDEW